MTTKEKQVVYTSEKVTVIWQDDGLCGLYTITPKGKASKRIKGESAPADAARIAGDIDFDAFFAVHSFSPSR